MSEVVADITLKSIECCECGVVFGLTRLVYNSLRDTRVDFFCPRGHRQYFPGESELARLKREAEYLEAERDRAYRRADHQERRAAAYKGHLTRTKKRVSNGVCPCCNRHFKNVERHMRAQHPEYVEGGAR